MEFWEFWEVWTLFWHSESCAAVMMLCTAIQYISAIHCFRTFAATTIIVLQTDKYAKIQTSNFQVEVHPCCSLLLQSPLK